MASIGAREAGTIPLRSKPMNLYASTLEGIRQARKNKQQRLQREMADAAFRRAENESRQFRLRHAAHKQGIASLPNQIGPVAV